MVQFSIFVPLSGTEIRIKISLTHKFVCFSCVIQFSIRQGNRKSKHIIIFIIILFIVATAL